MSFELEQIGRMVKRGLKQELKGVNVEVSYLADDAATAALIDRLQSGTPSAVSRISNDQGTLYFRVGTSAADGGDVVA